jgi:tyrosine-protein kinase Etk/Wzc
VNRLAKYIAVILRWRRLIFWNTLILTVIAVAVSFLLPPRYTATAQLLPPSDENDMFGLSGVLGGGVGGSLSRLRTGMLGGSAASDMMVGILGSRTVVQAVAERCSVAKCYRIKPGKIEAATKQLREMTRLSAGDEGIVRISVEAKDRQLAADAANTYIVELDSFLRQSNISRGHNMRVFIERRLAQIDSSLSVASDSLRVFQERYKVASVDDETKAAIDVYAQMKSQLSAKEAMLEGTRAVASDDNPYAAGLLREVAGLRDELGKLERGGPSAGFGVGFGVSFERLPAVSAEFARRYLSFRIQDESYATLYQQYEYARILEARDTPSLTVLDYAVPPERRSSPRRALIIAAVFLFSFAAGVCFAFIAEYFSFVRTSRPDEYEAWRHLSQQVSVSAGMLFKRSPDRHQ